MRGGKVTPVRRRAVMAEFAPFIPVRQKPARPIETFSTAEVERVPVRMDTEDAATVLTRQLYSPVLAASGMQGGVRWCMIGDTPGGGAIDDEERSGRGGQGYVLQASAR